ncbi:MAG: copper resistance protein B [Pseudomonadales bacterium]|nr:copper resistance protein B [Pseudomonadales bacterium]
MRALIFRALVVTALLQGSGVFAQDHVHPSTVDTAHQHEMPAPQAEPDQTQSGHQHSDQAPEVATPAHVHHAAEAPVELPLLRDPHGYSGGYERHSGPYLVAPDAQMDMSDGKQFAGLRMERLELLQDTGAAMEGWAWYGDSYRRLLLRGKAVTEDGDLEEGVLDLVRSHAVHPFWDWYGGAGLQAHEQASRAHVLMGLKGLAPYWFELDASLSLDERGRAGVKVEAEYEWLLTQRLVLQPRLDVSAYSRADPALALGEGASELLLGLRLRYEFSRRFAPYVGVERRHWLGQSADLQPAGVPARESRWVIGLRFWF